MSKVTTKDELAKIAIQKNLIKEYTNSNSERTVYLNDGTEFQIYLKNPYQTHLGIKIYVNNQSIGNMLVLKPGQSFWLDRFVNENKKFLFSTYEVENTPEMKYAIDKNGWVKVEFYHEREKAYLKSYPSITWTGGPYNGIYYDGSSSGNSYDFSFNSTVLGSSCDTVNYCNTSFNMPTASSAGTRGITSDSTVPTASSATHSKNAKKSIETGRVEKGSRSNQEFEYCDIDFEYYSFKTEHIHILPTSQKKVNVEETRRRYCSQCGKKVSPKDKFCSNCGAKLY